MLGMGGNTQLPKISYLSSGDGCAGPDGQSASVYERAMAAFGAIMQFYDPLRSFPLWGFGGQVGHFTYRD